MGGGVGLARMLAERQSALQHSEERVKSDVHAGVSCERTVQHVKPRLLRGASVGGRDAKQRCSPMWL